MSAESIILRFVQIGWYDPVQRIFHQLWEVNEKAGCEPVFVQKIDGSTP